MGELPTQAGGAPTEGAESAISPSVAATATEDANDTTSGVATQEGVETTNAEGGQSAPRLVPQEDLDRLRSTYDRKVSDLEKQAKEYSTALSQLEQALLQMRWDGLPEDERAAEQAEYQKLLVERAYQAKAAELKAEQDRLNQMAAPLYAMKLAEKYHVPVDDLLEAETPAEMERMAKRLSVYASKAKLAERKESGVDKMDTSGGTGVPTWDGLRGPELLTHYFRNHPVKDRRR